MSRSVDRRAHLRLVRGDDGPVEPEEHELARRVLDLGPTRALIVLRGVALVLAARMEEQRDPSVPRPKQVDRLWRAYRRLDEALSLSFARARR